MDLINKIKGSTGKLLSRLPEPVKNLISLKSDQERQTYLESLTEENLQAILKWFTYVLLAGDILGKSAKLGIKIPSDVRSFLENVDLEVKKAGKLSMKAIEAAVEKVQKTIKIAIAIPIILFGAFLLLNPAVAAGIFVSAVAIEASAFLFMAANPKWIKEEQSLDVPE